MMCHRQFCTLDFDGIFVGADSGGGILKWIQMVDMKMVTFWIDFGGWKMDQMMLFDALRKLSLETASHWVYSGFDWTSHLL